MNKYTPGKPWKTAQNDVSIFIAGFKAAMVRFGKIKPKDVEYMFYSGIEAPNLAREYYRAYTSEKFDTEGLEKMYNKIDEPKESFEAKQVTSTMYSKRGNNL